MSNESYDTDAEPVVQLTDMPVMSDPMEHSHPAVSSSTGGFDKTKLILPVSILIAAVLVSGSVV